MRGDWKELYNLGQTLQGSESVDTIVESELIPSEQGGKTRLFHMFNSKYILTNLRSGLILIDPMRAHERILYESYIQNIAHKPASSQQLLFPETIELSPIHMEVLLENLDSLKAIGFDVEEFGKQSIKVNGTPAEGGDVDVEKFFPEWIEDYITEKTGGKNRHETVARTMARRMRTRMRQTMKREEMEDLVDRLFGSEQPYHNPSGRPIIVNITSEEIDKKI